MDITPAATLEEIIARLEKLEEEKAKVSLLIKQTYISAKQLGFEKDILKEILEIKKVQTASLLRLQDLYKNLAKWRVKKDRFL